MDANTPINIPIRLEQWIHDNYMEVETIIIDARPILDATDFDNLPEWEDWGADFIAEDAQRIGLLKMWSGPFTVELFNCDEYPDYLEWRKTHKTVEDAAEHILDLSKKELLWRIEETKKQLDKYVSQYEALSGENPLDVLPVLKHRDSSTYRGDILNPEAMRVMTPTGGKTNMSEEYWKRLCRSFNKKYVLEIETRLQEKTHDSYTLTASSDKSK